MADIERRAIATGGCGGMGKAITDVVLPGLNPNRFTPSGVGEPKNDAHETATARATR